MNQDIEKKKTRVREIEATCAPTKKKYELLLKEKKKSFRKLIPEVSYPSPLHPGWKGPHIQVVINCGPILFPDIDPLLDYRSIRKEDIEKECAEATRAYDFLIKEEKKSLWKLVPGIPSQNFTVAIVLRCRPIIVP